MNKTRNRQLLKRILCVNDEQTEFSVVAVI